MSIDVRAIRYCPRCTSANYTFLDDRRWRCAACDLVYYHNIAAACAVILTRGDQLLLTLRKSDPGAGLLDLPGGFVDPDESVEAAIIREVHEELGMVIDTPRYCASYQNRYYYREIEYRTLDLIFTASVPEDTVPVAADDVAEVVLVRPEDIDFEKIAFASIRQALQDFRGDKFRH
ncbi:MAG: NUDIX domain-containing protein [Desulfuromonadaceae bacterium]|nr:NUDIX domain-containing protein [Desulfuromonadaceae bacterium]